jgi:hypothetical protein
MAENGTASKPLSYVALPQPETQVEWLGGGEVCAVAASPDSLWTAGAFGVMNEAGVQTGLPSLRVSSMILWRGRPLVALEAGGLFLLNGQRWEELRTGFGALRIRYLLESSGGELYIGAKEGLYRTQWGGNAIERLHAAPVRSIALGSGIILAGGEAGLIQIAGGRSTSFNTPDLWIDWIGIQGNQLAVLTAQGLALGSLNGEMALMPQEVKGAAQLGENIYVITENAILKMGSDRRFTQEYLPQIPRRAFAAGGLLFADTDIGLFKKGPKGWTLARPRPSALPPGSTHVTAMAHFQGKMAVGAFDGGLAVGTWASNGTSSWQALPMANAWGINAILPSGGALTIASLRGASRLDAHGFKPLAPSGAAFSLASTTHGIAVGYGQGVLLPGGQFLSAFHGLPGNQALALLQDDFLYVGTPSGLGAIFGTKVAWRTVAGDGLLPHPWVTALASYKNAVYIGTYGGGIVRRIHDKDNIKGRFDHFSETDRLKVNVGCLAVFKGSLFVGTDGNGLYRLNSEGTMFDQLDLPLPSASITALMPDGDFLLVGTNEGIARLHGELAAKD